MPSLFSVYLSGFTAIFPVLFFGSIFSAAAGAVLPRSVSVYFSVLAVSMAAAINILVLNVNPIPFGGNAPYRIVKMAGTVSEDSRPVTGGRNVFVLEITGTEGYDTMELSSKGICTVFYPGREWYYKGERLRLSGVLRLKKGIPCIYAGKGEIFKAGWSSDIYGLRSKIIKHTGNKINTLDSVSADLLTAFLLGRKGNVSNPVFRDFIRSGAAHLLALSGMHLGIITGFLMMVLSPLLGRKTAFYLSMPVTAFYIFLTGASPSIVRAYILMFLGGLAYLHKGRADPLALLSIASVIQLTLSPGSADSLSFKLSYLAVAGILIFQRKINRVLPGIIPPGIRGILSASISAQIATLPVSLLYFGKIYPSGIISSVVMAPLVMVFLLSGIIYVLIPALHLGILHFALDTAGAALAFSASVFSSIPAINIPEEGIFPAVLTELLILTLIFLVRYAVIRRNNGTSEKLRLGK